MVIGEKYVGVDGSKWHRFCNGRHGVAQLSSMYDVVDLHTMHIGDPHHLSYYGMSHVAKTGSYILSPASLGKMENFLQSCPVVWETCANQSPCMIRGCSSSVRVKDGRMAGCSC